MVNVSKIKEGIVIDHIRAGHGYKIFQQLGLDRLDGCQHPRHRRVESGARRIATS